MHALMQALSAVRRARTGACPSRCGSASSHRRRKSSRAGETLAEGAKLLAEVGARPSDAPTLDEYYVRTWAEPSVDVHGLAGGSPDLVKTVLPVEARANVSIRIAPGQNVADVSAAFERLLREAAPEGAEVEVELQSSREPGLVSPDAPALGLAREAFEHGLRAARRCSCGSAGSVPVVASLAARGIPTISTGIATRRLPTRTRRTRSFPRTTSTLGVEAVRETYRRLGQLG